MKIDIDALFQKRKDEPVWNTSYPLSPIDWDAYRVVRPLSFAKEKYLSFYVHIPFCKQLCSFCEYSRILCPNEDWQRRYINILGHDICKFLSEYDDFVLKGFDIGGGTPTALSEVSIAYLLDIYDYVVSRIEKAFDYEPSIEGSFNTITEGKLRRVVQSDIFRLSLGIQSTNHSLLKSYNRESVSLGVMKDKLNMAYKCGIKKVNLDLMYGLKFQSADTLLNDLNIIRELSPEQVTLYELRTNSIKENVHFCKSELYGQYLLLFEGLVDMGYIARFGQNTFSRNIDDFGTSSYLRNRMLQGVSYKGFGLSAQSMTSEGLSYNLGKKPGFTLEMLSSPSFFEQDIYMLPNHELASKYIAISAYNGSFSLSCLSRILRQDAWTYYEQQIIYCLENGLLEFDGDRFYITRRGFMYYGAVFSLFYAN